MTRPARSKPLAECLCGCGGRPVQGRFLPGHDQTLRKKLEQRVGGLVPLKALVEALDGYVAGDWSPQSLRRLLDELDDLVSIHAHDAAKASEEEAIPIGQAIEEIEWVRAAVQNPAFDFLREPSEDIYTLADGKAFRDAG